MAQQAGRERFVLTLLTNDPVLARRAERAGIDRVGLDLESHGKRGRQAPGNWISSHRPQDVPRIREVLERAQLFARTNPPHPDSAAEVEQLIESGVEVLMLPLFRTVAQAERFVSQVAGRARVSLLVETRAALESIGEIVRVAGVDEIHVGLNDLSRELRLRNPFALLAARRLEALACAVLEAGIPLGVGGVGCVGDRSLPIPPELVHAQHPRLGSDRALLRRGFLEHQARSLDMGRDVLRIRESIAGWARAGAAERERARRALLRRARALPPAPVPSPPLERPRVRP
jgi:hypothetical protein